MFCASIIKAIRIGEKHVEQSWVADDLMGNSSAGQSIRLDFLQPASKIDQSFVGSLAAQNLHGFQSRGGGDGISLSPNCKIRVLPN